MTRAHARQDPPPQPADQKPGTPHDHGAIKIEHLWRNLPADGIEMTTMVESFRRLYNDVRPHEMLDGERPRDRYLTPPTTPVQTRQTVANP